MRKIMKSFKICPGTQAFIEWPSSRAGGKAEIKVVSTVAKS